MTPQLQQAIKMLQLSNLELTHFVDAEIQQNPLLERREAQLAEATSPSAAEPAESPTTKTLPESIADDFTPEAAEQWQAAAGLDGDGSADFGTEPVPWRGRNGALDGGDR